MNTPEVKRRRGRPPKQERTFDDTKKAIIRTGLELITESGFQASGIEPILKKIHVPKGSFYYYFKNKEDFGQQVLTAYGDYFARKLAKHLERMDITPLERIALFVEDAKQGMEKFQFKRGCLVGNLMQEVPLLSETFGNQLTEILSDWQRRISICLTQAQQQNQLSEDMDPSYQARLFWSGWEGAVMQAKLFKSTQPLDDFWQYFSDNLPRK